MTRARIREVYDVIRRHVRITPTLQVSGADFDLDLAPLTLKLELFQHAGSFKTRGAFTHLLTRTIPPAGVVAASGGKPRRGGRVRREAVGSPRDHLRAQHRVAVEKSTAFARTAPR